MIAGVSTACFYPTKTEDALRILVKEGVGAAEIFLNSHSELAPDFLRGLRNMADAAGVRLLAIHPYTSGMEPMLFFSTYARRFEDGREYYRAYYEAANILGAGIVVFHGNFAQFEMTNEEYFTRFGLLLQDAGNAGVKLCHENVCRCTSRSPAFFRAMAAYLPDARFILDVKQAVRAGEKVTDFLQAMSGRIAHVHISDHTESEDCLSIGKGVFHIPEFLSQLQLQGFQEGVIVELYRENFGDVVELMSGYQQLCRDILTVS